MALLADAAFFASLVDRVPARHYLQSSEDAVNLRFMGAREREATKRAFKEARRENRLSRVDPSRALTTTEVLRERWAAERRSAAKEAARQARVAPQGGKKGDAHRKVKGSGTSKDDKNGKGGKDDSEADGAASNEVTSEAESEGEEGAGGVGGAAGGRVGDEAGPLSAPALFLPSGAAPTREELKARLHAKLEALRAARAAKDTADRAKESKGWREKALAKGRGKAAARVGKAERPARAAVSGDRAGKAATTVDRAGKGASKASGGAGFQVAASSGVAASEQLTLPRLDLGSDGRVHKQEIGGKRKAVSKQDLLKQLQAKKRAKGADGGAEPSAGGEGSEARASSQDDPWKTAALRASGVKVLDDAKRLKASIKRDEARKKKHAEAWKERLTKQNEEQQNKQDRRNRHIQTKVQKRKDKKIEKREKKLLRAGFEGRREGFATGSK